MALIGISDWNKKIISGIDNNILARSYGGSWVFVQPDVLQDRGGIGVWMVCGGRHPPDWGINHIVCCGDIMDLGVS